MALNEFEGTVMLVSHDRALLREVCDEFWLVTDGGDRAVRRRPRRLPALAARAVEGGRRAARPRSRRRRRGEAPSTAPGSGTPPARGRGDAPHRRRRAGSSARRPQGGRRRAPAARRRRQAAEEGAQPHRQQARRPVRRARRAGSGERRRRASTPPERAETGRRLKAIAAQIERARGALARAQHATRRALQNRSAEPTSPLQRRPP